MAESVRITTMPVFVRTNISQRRQSVWAITVQSSRQAVLVQRPWLIRPSVRHCPPQQNAGYAMGLLVQAAWVMSLRIRYIRQYMPVALGQTETA